MSKVLNIGLDHVVSMMEQGGSNMLLLDEAGKVTAVNKQFADVFEKNTSIPLFLGCNLLQHLKTESHDMPLQWIGLFMKGLAGHEASSIVLLKKSGHGHYWDISFKQIAVANEKPYTVVCTRDITRQKRAENKLVEQNKELKKINAELDRFVYSASHDLRSPLTSIKGLLGIIKSEEYNKENLASYLDYIEKSVEKLENFIAEIVNYSHNSRLEIKLQPIDFNQLITTAISKLQGFKNFKEVKMKLNIDDGFPFSSDSERLALMITNLITNSLLYRDPYKESYLEISVYKESGKAILKFEDNGVGIADWHLDKVFQMFFRANTESKGSGLGLYMVKEIAEKLKGTVSLQSELGKGTTIFIELPDRSEPIEQ
jgi:signal transduction histidine kinase